MTDENDGTDERTENSDDDDATDSGRTPAAHVSNSYNLGVHQVSRPVMEVAPRVRGRRLLPPARLHLGRDLKARRQASH